MAYCTVTDIQDQIEESQLIQLTDDEGAGEVAESRVLKAIADADEEINGYVGSRYPVPLSPVPPVVRKLSVDIALYNLYARRDQCPDARKDRYKNAIAFLNQIALGRPSLGVSDPDGNPPVSDAPEMSGENPRRTFTRDSMRGF